MSRNGRPLELPGLYWDEERDRYFPVSSKPQERPAKRKVDETDNVEHTTPNANNLLRNGRPSPTVAAYVRNIRTGAHSSSQRAQLIREITGKRFMNLSYIDVPVDLFECTDNVRSFEVAMRDEVQYILAGDLGGKVYIGQRGPIRPEYALLDTYDRLEPFHTLMNEVDHLQISGEKFIALATGESVKALIGDIDHPRMRMVHWPKRLFGDIFSVCFVGVSLALGVSRKVALIEDMNEVDNVRFLSTKSDVLSVHRTGSSKNIILAGCRSGVVPMFDVRAQKQAGRDLLGGRFQKKGFSSVVHINTIKEWQVLVSTMAGNLEMFDMRFTDRGTPITCFPGHVNSHTANLGITSDPSQEYLFAAGQDRRIRAWSLTSGYKMFDDEDVIGYSRPHVLGPVCLNKLVFEEAPRVLKVTEEVGGLRLWANEGQYIRNFNLGYHACNSKMLP